MVPQWHHQINNDAKMAPSKRFTEGKAKGRSGQSQQHRHRECFCLAYARFTRNTCQTALGENRFSEKQKTKRPEGRCYLI